MMFQYVFLTSVNFNLYKFSLKYLKSKELIFLTSEFCMSNEDLMNNYSEYMNSFTFNLSSLCNIIINNNFLVPLRKQTEANNYQASKCHRNIFYKCKISMIMPGNFKF